MKYLLVLLLVIPFTSSAQSDYLIDENGERLDCKNLTVAKNGKGEVFMISFVNGAGKKISFNESSGIPEFPEYSKSGQKFMLAPLKAEKPDGPKAYIRSVLEGNIELYADQIGRNYTPTKGGGKSASLNRLFVKIDGEWMDANHKKTFEKDIVSKMMSCMSFIQSRPREVKNTMESLKSAIEIYNSKC